MGAKSAACKGYHSEAAAIDDKLRGFGFFFMVVVVTHSCCDGVSC